MLLTRLWPHAVCIPAMQLIDITHLFPPFRFPSSSLHLWSQEADFKIPTLRIWDALCTSFHNFERKIEAPYFPLFVLSFLVLQYFLRSDTYAFLSSAFTQSTFAIIFLSNFSVIFSLNLPSKLETYISAFLNVCSSSTQKSSWSFVLGFSAILQRKLWFLFQNTAFFPSDFTLPICIFVTFGFAHSLHSCFLFQLCYFYFSLHPCSRGREGRAWQQRWESRSLLVQWMGQMGKKLMRFS